MIATLLQLAGLFGLLSLLAFGGGSGVLPDMQRAAVDVHHWLTGQEFLDLFAISRAAPGPGTLIVVLIGQKAAGLAGAAVAFVAMFTPSSLLVYAAARIWHGAARAPWRALVERALAPVAVGLTLASGLALIRGAEHGWAAYCVTAAATFAFAFTNVHPLVLLAGGAAVLLAAGALGT
ncbi:MAG: chromate transporter [Acetobacteraceae bacterium]|nr:chromate transporter [Acetobacteraceae bacterium]